MEQSPPEVNVSKKSLLFVEPEYLSVHLEVHNTYSTLNHIDPVNAQTRNSVHQS
jgi:hypothetical protein